DLQRKIAAAQKRLDDDRKHPVAIPLVATQRDVRTEPNPEYAELMTAKRDLVRSVSALTRRQADLNAALTKSRSRVALMPAKEIEWQKIEQDYNMTSSIRNNKRAQMEVLRLDEERDKATEALNLHLEVKPK